MLLQQFTHPLTLELTEAHAYEQESCQGEGQGAHPSFASRCRCPLHHPGKQESLSSLVSAGSAAKAGVFWGKLVYSCIPSLEARSVPFLWLVAAHSKDFQAHQTCQAVTCARLQSLVPLFLQPQALLLAGLGLGRGCTSGSTKQEPSQSCCGSGPLFCCCPLISQLEPVWHQIQQRSGALLQAQL